MTLNAVTSIASNANITFSNRSVFAGSDSNNPSMIAYDVSKADIPQTQASDLVSMVNDMASIEKNYNVRQTYHNIFIGLKSLPSQSVSIQSSKLNAISKDLGNVAKNINANDKVTSALNSLSNGTENEADSLAFKEISQDANLVASDASDIPSANDFDKKA